METGTQILIERMKTHPEEFGEGAMSKWGRVWAYAMEYLPEEDKKALKEASNRMRVEKFNEEVFKTLAGEAEPEGETIRYQAKERYAKGWTDPRGLFGGAIVKGEGQAVEYDHNLDAYKLTIEGAKRC